MAAGKIEFAVAAEGVALNLWGNPDSCPMKTSISVLLERKDSAIRSVPPTTTVTDAVQIMNTSKVSSVLVLEAGRLAGIFTERDVLRRVVGAKLDPAGITMAEVMSQGVTTVTRLTTIDEALEIFTCQGCRHLPVMDGENVIGLISIGDVSRWLAGVYRAEADQLKDYINGGYSP